MIFFFLLCSLFSLVFALPFARRDVWVPPITWPTNATVWVAGGSYNVTWDTSSMPEQVTNPIGQVYLRQGNATQSSPLAQGFPLSDGAVNVTVPNNTVADSDWRVVLFGDSGNWSGQFTIVVPSS